MKDDAPKRNSIVSSPDYRALTGQKLKQYRLECEFSMDDITDMTGIPKRTVTDIEKGKTTNIDYYVEYARAVQYPLETLTDFGIPLTPRFELSAEKRDKIRLTALVRRYILESGFLNEARFADDIFKQLVSLKLIPDDKDYATRIPGILRNLTAAGTVNVIEKKGNKNIYTLGQSADVLGNVAETGAAYTQPAKGSGKTKKG